MDRNERSGCAGNRDQHGAEYAALLARGIEPHIAMDPRGRRTAHACVRMRVPGLGYQWSQRCRKKIEELFGEAKDWHGLRRFRRRGLHRAGQEAHLIGWVLNLKRLASLLTAQAQPARPGDPRRWPS